jgi:metal-responsive CopG/Arc/MetJ family transcriptional regulator
MGGTPESRWKTIQLPEELLRRVDELVKRPELGYTSRAELVKDAVRRRVEELEALLRSKGEK